MYVGDKLRYSMSRRGITGGYCDNVEAMTPGQRATKQVEEIRDLRERREVASLAATWSKKACRSQANEFKNRKESGVKAMSTLADR